MKGLRIFNAILAALSFVCAFVVLFKQPMVEVQANDALFAGFFLLGCALTALYMWSDRMINGTIPEGRKMKSAK